jgi:aspartyl-tRNA(Asn)/glutamyl-tRNA(Gln) amidotransferase subunit A
MTSSTDVPGPITKTVVDAGMVLAVISGKDKNDATTVPELVNDLLSDIDKDIQGLKIGLPKEFFTAGIDAEVDKVTQEAIAKLKELGAELVEVSLPTMNYAVPVYYIITPSEISSNLARFDGIRYGFSEQEVKDLQEIYTKSRGIGFGPEVKRRVMLGTYVLSAGYFDAYYLKAQKVRTKIKEELDDVLSRVDCLLTPSSPHVAFKIGEQSDDPVTMYLEDIFMSGASLAGLPGMSIPCGFVGELPVGMQLVGKRFDEKTIFKVGNYFQKNTDFHTKKCNL